MGIVGHKIEQYLEITRMDYGAHYEIVTHRVVTELHATKGWRNHRRVKHLQRVLRLPPIRLRREATFTRFEPIHRTEPKSGHAEIAITPAMLMRHRERRRDVQIAENIARNKLEDQRLAGLR